MNPYVLLAAAEDCPQGMVSGLLDPRADPRALLRSPPAELPAAVRRRLLAPELRQRAQAWLDTARAAGLQALPVDHEQYPATLRELPLRPNLLFVRGDPESLALPGAVAVIGSRTPTPYGEGACRDFCTGLARAGLPIWSGLALGIDGLAHQEALAAGSPTVAVLAGGLDRIYPESHSPLASQIVAQGGALISEAPCGRSPHKGHFPRRNRILAGACAAVLVVEAGQKSGSLHTARFAAEYGKTVFALPGPYQSPRSAGCHSLLAEGAQLAASPSELLRELGVAQARETPEQSGLGLHNKADAEAILQVLRQGPRPCDLVMREARLEADRFYQALDELETIGLVCCGAGDLLHLQPR